MIGLNNSEFVRCSVMSLKFDWFSSSKYDYPFPYYVQLASYAQNKIFNQLL